MKISTRPIKDFIKVTSESGDMTEIEDQVVSQLDRLIQ